MVPTLRLCVLLSFITVGLGSVISSNHKSDNFELLILHNNDMHARFEQTSQLSGVCSPADREEGKCYGGFPRVAHVVKEARKKAAEGGPPVLYLNAGDTYTGTAWFTIYKWKIAAECINALRPDAVSFINNGFAPGTSPIQFTTYLQTPVLAANAESRYKQENFYKSTIFDIDGVKIGIIGYVKPENHILDNLEYFDEVNSIQDEVNKLIGYGANITIALGHSHDDIDIKIAKEVKDLTVVIAAHDFIDNNSSRTNVVKQENGREVLIVNSYDYNKYLGKIKLTFDKNGKVIEHNEEQILLDESINEDKEAQDLVNSLTSNIIGTTAVVLDGESCGIKECNFGNFIADVIIQYYAVRFKGERWTDAPIAIIPSKNIASSISHVNRPAEITLEDLQGAISSGDFLVTVTMSGPTLLRLLEESVADYNSVIPTGNFLQYSGLRVVYDLTQPHGSRVKSALGRCWSCNIPQLYVIDDRLYKVLMPKSLSQNSLFNGLEKVELEYDEITCLKEYIGNRSPIYPEVSGRIQIQTNVIGSTAVKLDGETCNVGECNLGNLITDAMSYQAAIRNTEWRWNDSPASIIRSSAIKASINPANKPGDITMEDLNRVFPNPEKIVSIMTPGPTIIQLLEESVANLEKDSPTDLFLQHAGLRVTYDLSLPPGSRVVNVMVRCCSCTYPQYYNIHGRSYNLMMQKSLSEHPLFAGLEVVELPYDDITCLKEYIQHRSPVFPDVIGRNNFVATRNNIIGRTAVVLDGETCNTGECNLGNLITDAMSYQSAIRNTEERWNDSPAAIIRSSAIKASIAPKNKDITVGDLFKIFPNPEKIVSIMTPGPTIIQLLEESVADLEEDSPTDLFLQHSGLRVTYDLSLPPGSRVVNVMVRCCSCTYPQYYNIHGRSYNLMMQKSMSEHPLFVDLDRVELPYDDVTCLRDYIEHRTPVYPDVIGRNTFIDHNNDGEDEDGDGDNGDGGDGDDGVTNTPSTKSAAGLSSSLALLLLTYIFLHL